MKFGPIPVRQAEHAILAHSVKLDGQRFKKGRVLSIADISALRQAQVESVIAAQLESGDVGEDEAANRLADVVCGPGIEASAAFTGRCNLFAAEPGLLFVDRQQLDRINLIHEDLTVATLEPYVLVDRRQMVATVKIIPFAVAHTHLQACMHVARSAATSVVKIVPLKRQRIGLIQTTLPGVKDSVLDKTAKVLQGRLDVLQAEIIRELRCAHQTEVLAEAIVQQQNNGADIILVAGASAIVDRRDVIPAAIEHIGGRIEHYGMPVDPGNLLLLGYYGDLPVVGLPGCARSPKYNGFDIVLPRLVADVKVSAQEIMKMGAGGLLKEISSRPLPRAEASAKPVKAPARAPRIAAIVLAAGQSRRMGQLNKLVAEIKGEAMLKTVVQTVAAAQVDHVIVVTGHEQSQVHKALAGLSGLQFVHNRAYADGLSTSLQCGLAALPDDVDAALICLGDMPQVSRQHINRLIAGFDPVEGRSICVPTFQGKRGNPVLWSKRFFPEMREISGDVGSRHLLGDYSEQVCEIEMQDRGVLFDVDTPEILEAINNA